MNNDSIYVFINLKYSEGGMWRVKISSEGEQLMIGEE